MQTTDITTKTQAKAGYRITRLAYNLGQSATTGVTHDRVASTYEIRHHGRMVASVSARKDLALALATYEGRVCLGGADALDGNGCGASEDDGILCTYRPVTVRCAA